MLLVAAGVAFELLVLSLVQSDIEGPRLALAVVWSAVAWSGCLLLGSALWGGGRGEGGGWWRSIVAAAPVVWLVLSWGFYDATGRFGGLESARFAYENLGMLVRYALQVEPIRILSFGVGAVLVAWLWGQGVRRWTGGRRRRLGFAWGGAVLLASALGWALAASYGESLRVWEGQPLASLVGRLLSPQEKLGDCLQVSDLREREDLERGGSVALAHEPSAPWSVLWIAVESLRPDVLGREHQGQEVMPHLKAIAADAMVFSRVWAASTHSDYSDVSALSGTYPLRSRRHHYYRTTDPWPRPLVWNLLSAAGYRTALISAQNEAWGSMDQFLATDGLDLLWDSRVAAAEGFATRAAFGDEAFRHEVDSGLRAGKLDDALVTDRALEWLANVASPDVPFLLSLNFQSSHFPYELASEAGRPFAPSDFDFEPSFTWYPPSETETVRNAYYNALFYVDRQLGRLTRGLEELGLAERTLLVVYGENGEAFHENGQVTHAGAPYEAGLRVPVVIADGRREAQEIDYPMSLVDLPPTVAGLLGLPADPAWQGIDVLRPPHEAPDRVLFFHNENPITRADGVVLGGRWKYWHDREIDTGFLFDLEADPSEQRRLREVDVSGPLEDLVAEFRCRQLRYYEHPLWPSLYQPPAPPGVESAALTRSRVTASE